ncbi:hypothetical protein G7Y79_00017g043150 [Physcia stellaris]|nr:hypothetical protein G7Y79_00017g043150 [Physcia stellaris]
MSRCQVNPVIGTPKSVRNPLLITTPTYDGYSFRKLDLGASPPSEAETQTAPQTLDNALPNRPFRRSRQPSTQARNNTQTQLIQRTPVEPDSYTFRKLDLGASPPSEAEAQTAPRPLFRYDNNREPPPTTNERPSTHPQRPPRAGALDLRNLSAQPAPNRPPFQRPPPRQTTPNRSRGVGSDARRPGGTEAARKAPSSTPRSRPRQPRTNASSQRPNIYNSKDADRGLSEEQLAYMREKEEAKAPKPQPYVPAAGAAGVEAEMGDEGRKQDANEGSGVNGDVLRKEFDGRKIAERMFRGEYVFDGKQEEGVLGTLRRQAVRNGTYFPQDGRSLAEKVRSLLPAEMTGGGGKTARA